MKPQLETLLKAAVLAPSPDNNQPWLFQVDGDGRLILYHDVARALPSDVDGMFDMIALGAALENLALPRGNRGLNRRLPIRLNLPWEQASPASPIPGPLSVPVRRARWTLFFY